MNKIITAFLLLASTGLSHGQFTKGTIMAGGSAGFTIHNSDNTSNGVTTSQGRTTSFTMAPQVGYFLMDKLALGAGLNVNLSSFKPGSSGTTQTGTRLLFSPFVRYYFPPGLYAQGTFDVGSSKVSSTGGGSATTSLIGWSFLAGYPILLNDFVALEPQAGYEAFSNRIDSANKTVDGQFFVRIGLQVYLKKK